MNQCGLVSSLCKFFCIHQLQGLFRWNVLRHYSVWRSSSPQGCWSRHPSVVLASWSPPARAPRPAAGTLHHLGPAAFIWPEPTALAPWHPRVNAQCCCGILWYLRTIIHAHGSLHLVAWRHPTPSRQYWLVLQCAGRCWIISQTAQTCYLGFLHVWPSQEIAKAPSVWTQMSRPQWWSGSSGLAEEIHQLMQQWDACLTAHGIYSFAQNNCEIGVIWLIHIVILIVLQEAP
jgi:hypothetical protein